MKINVIKVFLGLILINNFYYINAQNNDKYLNFIILVDGEIAIGTIAKPKINAKTNDTLNIITLNYYPGRLIMRGVDFEKLVSAHTNAIVLNFDYYEYLGGKKKKYHYEIPIEKGWLQESYVILRIYNLNKKKYKREYDPLSNDKNYTFEIDSPDGTFRRIKN